jgi:2-(1,2-epoxy-1,2-dihydrophenyl)acetyl-CoA isomerase
MMDAQTNSNNNSVLYNLQHAVAVITLNRPALSNSIDLDTALFFREVVARAASDGACAVLVTGAGKRFCAGGDLVSMVASPDRPAYLRQLASALEIALREMSELPIPVVAAVQGAVAGAGLAVILNCDVVVAAASTKFVAAYAGVGLTPDCGVSYLLPRAIGQQRALELALTGRVLTAEEAMSWGLVTRLTGNDALMETAMDTARGLALGPTRAFGETKRLIRSSWNGSRAQSAEDEVETIARAVQTDEAAALISSFLG